MMKVWRPIAQKTGSESAQDALPLHWLVPAGLFLLILPTNHTMALRLISLFGALIIALLAWRKFGMPSIPIRWPLSAWVVLALASATWSADPVFTLNEVKTEIGYGVTAFFVFFVLTRSERDLFLGAHTAVAALALTIILALVGWLLGQHKGLVPYHRWDWVHGYASYSTYLATAVPVLGLWLAVAGRWQRTLGYVLIALVILIAYLLGNRMFWISTAGTLAVFLVLAVLRGRPAQPTVRRAPLLGGMLLCAVMFMLVAKEKPADYARTGSHSAISAHLAETFTQNERLYMWSFWLDRIAERPWTGVGFGRDLPHWVFEKPERWPDLYFAHAHNLVLDYGAQLGIPGILVLLWLFGSMARQFWRFARNPDKLLSLVGMTGLALITAILSKNMTDDLFWRTDALVFWSFAGMLLGYGTRRLQALRGELSAPSIGMLADQTLDDRQQHNLEVKPK